MCRYPVSSSGQALMSPLNPQVVPDRVFRGGCDIISSKIIRMMQDSSGHDISNIKLQNGILHL